VPLVHCGVAGRVAQLRLDHPPVNAFSTALWTALTASLSELRDDERVHAVILTGAGCKVFSAGADVKEAATLSAEQERARHELVYRGLNAVATFPLPLVCAVNGAAIGGGLNIAALCDTRIAAESAVFALPEINHGRTGGGGAFLRHLGVAEGLIRLLLLTGRRIGAAEALGARIVDEVVPLPALADRAQALAGELAAKPRAALIATKAAILASSPPGEWLSPLREDQEPAKETEQSQEGVRT
jgi:enoyl-CoA hydratase/carnithine racemase